MSFISCNLWLVANWIWLLRRLKKPPEVFLAAIDSLWASSSVSEWILGCLVRIQLFFFLICQRHIFSCAHTLFTYTFLRSAIPIFYSHETWLELDSRSDYPSVNTDDARTEALLSLKSQLLEGSLGLQCKFIFLLWKQGVMSPEEK